MSSSPVKICPEASELLPLGQSACHVCTKEFSNQSRLAMHLQKCHSIKPTVESVPDVVECHYYCPAEVCKYNGGKSHFKELKQLRQHYQRVHLVKNLSCPICITAKFSLEKDLRYHLRICSKRKPQPKLLSGPLESHIDGQIQAESNSSTKNGLQLKTTVAHRKRSKNTLVVKQVIQCQIQPKPTMLQVVIKPKCYDFGGQTTVESDTIGAKRRKRKRSVVMGRTVTTQTEMDGLYDNNSFIGELEGSMRLRNHYESFSDYFPTDNNRLQPSVAAVGCMAIPLPTDQADFRCQTYFPVDTADAAVMVDFLRSENGIATQFPPFDYGQFEQSDTGAVPSVYEAYGVEDEFGGISSNIETQTDMREFADLFADDIPSPIHMETQTGGIEADIDLNDIQTQTNLIDFIDAGFHSSVETQTWIHPNTQL